MSISPIGSPMIGVTGPQGPGAAAAQIASNIANSDDGASIALDVELAVLQKALEASQADVVDLRV